MSGKKHTKVSIYLSYLLRHHPEAAKLDMDRHGWVSVEQLLSNVNAAGQHTLTWEQLKEIVAADEKGRYRFNADGTRIKACQGHSIPWVEPELEILPPPEYLYHGTTAEALAAILKSGAILRMERHAVHMQADAEKAWKSARRWKGKTPVVLKIAASALAQTGMPFGKSENDVWCCETVPASYIAEVLH